MNQLSIDMQAMIAWWVGGASHGFWEQHCLDKRPLFKRCAIVSRARGVIAHDRVLNLLENKVRARQ